jgi:hypothetical protein
MRGYAAGSTVKKRCAEGGASARRRAAGKKAKAPIFCTENEIRGSIGPPRPSFVWSHLNEFDGENRAAAFISL